MNQVERSDGAGGNGQTEHVKALLGDAVSAASAVESETSLIVSFNSRVIMGITHSDTSK